jgi:hypothetical protein
MAIEHNPLEGLSESSWGGRVLLGLPLTVSNGEGHRAIIESCVLYPVAEQQQPEEAFIVPLDFGKRAIKGGGVDENGFFQSRVIVDAYSAAKQIQMEEDEGEVEAESIWQVMGPEKKLSESFRCGARALRMADALPVNETLAVRLEDLRVRNMTIATIVQNLRAIGVEPGIVEQDTYVVKKRNVLLPIGLPADDINKRNAETTKALGELKGLYTVEEFNSKTGETTTWLIDIVGIIPAPQPRGTHYTATKNVDGTSAIKKKIVTVIDIGGGDIYAYEVDSSSGTITDARRLGDGTISIAHELRTLIDETYGIHVSEAEAQEALYTKHILKSGEEANISTLLERLKPRYANLLTTVNITRRMLSTFIIFTGGGTALLHDEIREKMHSLPGKRLEGEDFLIIPPTIAPLANCIGLFAHGYYKIQQVIRSTVAKYLEMNERRKYLQQYIPQLASMSGKEEASQKAREELIQLQQTLSTHVGQYYKQLQQQMLLESAHAVRS